MIDYFRCNTGVLGNYFQNKDTIMTVDLWSLYDVDVKTAPKEVRDAVAFLCDNTHENWHLYTL